MVKTVRTLTLEQLADLYGIEIISVHVVQRGYPVLTFEDLVNIKFAETQPEGQGGWTAPKVHEVEVMELRVTSVADTSQGVGIAAHATHQVTVFPHEEGSQS